MCGGVCVVVVCVCVGGGILPGAVRQAGRRTTIVNTTWVWAQRWHEAPLLLLCRGTSKSPAPKTSPLITSTATEVLVESTTWGLTASRPSWTAASSPAAQSSETTKETRWLERSGWPNIAVATQNLRRGTGAGNGGGGSGGDAEGRGRERDGDGGERERECREYWGRWPLGGDSF